MTRGDIRAVLYDPQQLAVVSPLVREGILAPAILSLKPHFYRSSITFDDTGRGVVHVYGESAAILERIWRLREAAVGLIPSG